MKQFVDFLPVLLFVGVYIFSDIYAATAALIAAAIGQVVVFKLTRWPISKQMWIVFWVAIVSGSLTLIFQNKLFIQWKPTVVYWVMGMALIGSRAVGRGDLIKSAFGQVLALPDRAWGHLTWGWAAAMVLAGVANLYVAYGYSEELWVTYKLVSAFVIPIVLTASSIAYLAATSQLPREEIAEDEPVAAPEDSHT